MVICYWLFEKSKGGSYLLMGLVRDGKGEQRKGIERGKQKGSEYAKKEKWVSRKDAKAQRKKKQKAEKRIEEIG